MLRFTYNLIKILLHYTKVHALLFLILSSLAAILQASQLWCIEYLVNQVVEFAQESKGNPWYGIALLLFFVALQAVCSWQQKQQLVWIESDLLQKLAPDMLCKLKTIDYTLFEHEDTYDTIHMVRDEPYIAYKNGFVFFVNLVNCGWLFGGMILFFAKISPLFALLNAMVLIVIFVADYKIMRATDDVNHKLSADERRLNYLSTLFTKENSLLEIKVYKLLNHFGTRIDTLLKKVMHTRIKTTIISQKYFLLSSLLMVLWVTGMLFYVGNAYVGSAIAVGAIVACFRAIGDTYALSSRLSEDFSEYVESIIDIENYQKLLNLENDVRLLGSAVLESVPERVSVCFKNVSFRYPGADRYALRNINCEFSSDKTIAIVGSNGAGKSTFIKLMCGLYIPTEGDVLMNGQNTRELKFEAISHMITTVFQQPIEYRMTVAENLALYAKKNAVPTCEQMNWALDKVELSDSLNLDTKLGRWDEHTVELSGGQWQRLSIARALLANSKMILFDEPTAALDPIAESRLYETLLTLIHQKGTVIVSHRLISSKLAEHIYVFSDGAIIESGEHSELIAKPSYYRDMYEMQASWYQVSAEGNVTI